AAGNGDLSAVEVVARAQEPVADFTGQVKSPPFRHGAARRRELRAARYIGAGGTGIEHGRRIERRSGERDLVIHRVGALGQALNEAQVSFDDVAVDGKIPVRETGEAETGGGAAVEALPAWVPVVQNAKMGGERTEGRSPPAEDVDLR